MVKSSIKKRDNLNRSSFSGINKTDIIPDGLIKFSFRYFSTNEKFGYPDSQNLNKYFPVLIDRLKYISGMTLSDFMTNKCKTLRNHTHNWDKTSEPQGYKQLSDSLQQSQPWQFCLSANEHGRVHGFIISDVFYIVWLDPNHALYPKN
jgi:hypothetical protein